MDIKIYQIDSEKDTNRIKSENFKNTIKYAGNIDPDIYKTVFEGNVDCNDLEDAYFTFNINHPVSHQGHSLSISDIVEVKGDSPLLVGKLRIYTNKDNYNDVDYTDNNLFNAAVKEAKEKGIYAEPISLEGKNIPSVDNGFYFCDKFGFTRLEDGFDTSIIAPMQGVRMLVVEPHKQPYEALIKDDLKDLQRAVNGNIERIYADNKTFFIINECGKVDGLEGNRMFNNDVIVGTFLIAGDDCDDYAKNLTDEQIVKYKKLFEKDEVYTQAEVEERIHINFLNM